MLVVVIGVLAILPFALRLPDAVMRTVYPLKYKRPSERSARRTAWILRSWRA